MDSAGFLLQKERREVVQGLHQLVELFNGPGIPQMEPLAMHVLKELAEEPFEHEALACGTSSVLSW